MADLDLLYRLEAGRRELLEACLGLTDAQLRQRPAAGEWAVIEVLAHLPDAGLGWVSNIQHMLAEDNPTLANFDDTAWKAAHTGVLEWPAARVFDALRSSHAEAVATVAKLSDASLQRAGIGRRGPTVVRDLIGRYAGHDVNHANQVREIRAALGV